jgi:hypothetical protein
VEGILLDWIGGRLLDWLPRWIVRRFVKLEAIARQVKLGLLSTGAVTFGLTEAAPVVRVWFQVENHSGLDVVLDRIVLEVWAGQPIAYGVMARRTTIARHTTAREVGPFVAALTVPAIERVTHITSTPLPISTRNWAHSQSSWAAAKGQCRPRSKLSASRQPAAARQWRQRANVDRQRRALAT